MGVVRGFVATLVFAFLPLLVFSAESMYSFVSSPLAEEIRTISVSRHEISCIKNLNFLWVFCLDKGGEYRIFIECCLGDGTISAVPSKCIQKTYKVYFSYGCQAIRMSLRDCVWDRVTSTVEFPEVSCSAKIIDERGRIVLRTDGFSARLSYCSVYPYVYSQNKYSYARVVCSIPRVMPSKYSATEIEPSVCIYEGRPYLQRILSTLTLSKYCKYGEVLEPLTAGETEYFKIGFTPDVVGLWTAEVSLTGYDYIGGVRSKVFEDPKVVNHFYVVDALYVWEREVAKGLYLIEWGKLRPLDFMEGFDEMMRMLFVMMFLMMMMRMVTGIIGKG